MPACRISTNTTAALLLAALIVAKASNSTLFDFERHLLACEPRECPAAAVCAGHGAAFPEKGWQVECRGAALLWEQAGVHLSASAVPRTVRCAAGGPCELTLAACGNTAALRDVSVYARLAGPALVVGRSTVRGEALVVTFAPPLPGTYDLTELDLFWYADSAAPGAKPVYLGDSEMRCAPFDPCATSPRKNPACAGYTRVSGSGSIVFEVEPAPAPPAYGGGAKCRGSEKGYWARLNAREGGQNPMAPPVSGDVLSIFEENAPKVRYYWTSPECEFVYYSPEAAAQCFQDKAITQIVFSGDSLVQALFKKTGQHFGAGADDDKPVRTSLVGGVTAYYEQVRCLAAAWHGCCRCRASPLPCAASLPLPCVAATVRGIVAAAASPPPSPLPAPAP